MTMTETRTDIGIDLEALLGSGSDEPEDHAHIVERPGGSIQIPADQWVEYAMGAGLYVEALCGYRYVPQGTDESKPMCKRCVEIWEQMAWG